MVTRICAALAFCVIFLGNAWAHDWYSNTYNPNGANCCGKKDCRPLTADEIRIDQQTGEVEVLIKGAWYKAEDPRWFLGPSPDGSWHACIYKTDNEPRCIWGSMGV